LKILSPTKKTEPLAYGCRIIESRVKRYEIAINLLTCGSDVSSDHQQFVQLEIEQLFICLTRRLGWLGRMHEYENRSLFNATNMIDSFSIINGWFR
jgi:hypothetical protein